MNGARHDLESLLSENGWVRALARTLSRDGWSADDLAQEAYARAFAAPPPAGKPLRRWFALVLRNLALEERRKSGSRGSREAAAARSEQLDSETALFEKLETHRSLVEAVSRLDEPYRAAILLRYFEDLSPAEIAERTGAPIRTVHTRLARALARLRDDLDRGPGGRERWLLALVPFAAEPSRSIPAAIGALILEAKIKVAIAAVAVIGVCATIALRDDAPTAPEPLARAADVRQEPKLEAERAVRPLEAAPAVTERRASDPAPAPAKIAAAAPPSANVLHGRVVDVLGTPLGGVRVRATDAGGKRVPAEIATAADGRFTLADPPKSGKLEIDSPRWTTVLRPEVSDDGKHEEYVLVAAPAVDLAGIVLDEARKPIEAATVAVPIPFAMRSRFTGLNLDRSSSVEQHVRTDAQGRFELEGVPSFQGAELVTKSATNAEDHRPVPSTDEPALEIVMKKIRKEPTRISGHVVDASGNPVEDAHVTFGVVATKSGPGGAFVLVTDSMRRAEPSGARADPATAWSEGTLQAAKQGYQLARFERASKDEPWPEDVVLALGPPALSIHGRVIDADGKPVAGAEVWTSDEQKLGFVEVAGGGMTMRVQATAESIARGETYSKRALADGDGRFELRGLSARDYRIVALDKRSLGIAVASFAAGVENAELRIPREELHERVAGLVTSLSGEPLAGVTVVFERQATDDRGTVIERIESAGTATDEDGRFELHGVSKHVSAAKLRGPDLDLAGFHQPIAPGADIEKLAFVVPLRLHVQVEGGEQQAFTQVGVLDAEEHELLLSIFHGTFAFTPKRIQVVDGRTEPFAVSEAARTLVLYKGEEEVGRHKLELERGKVNLIRP